MSSGPLETRNCPACGAEVEGAAEDFAEASLCPGCDREVVFVLPQAAARKKQAFKRTRVSAKVNDEQNAAKVAAAREEGLPICQMVIHNDQGSALSAVFGEIGKFLREEQLPYVPIITRHADTDTIELTDEDIHIAGEVIVYDLGNQFIRYFLTFLSIFGVGACKLKISFSLLLPGQADPLHFTLSRQQGVGIFGGEGTSLMRICQLGIAKALASRVIRPLTGRYLLTRTLQGLALGSFVSGLIGIGIPFLGLLAVALGIPAWLMMQPRANRTRQWLAIVGTILGAVTALLWLILLMLNG